MLIYCMITKFETSAVVDDIPVSRAVAFLSNNIRIRTRRGHGLGNRARKLGSLVVVDWFVSQFFSLFASLHRSLLWPSDLPIQSAGRRVFAAEAG